MTGPVVEYVARWLVDHPDDIEIEEVEGERGTLVLEVSVHPEDMGKIIGRQGRAIRALRVLAKAAGQKDQQNIMVEVVD